MATAMFLLEVAPFSFAQEQEKTKEELREELTSIQAEIDDYNKVIEEKKKEERTLGREVSIFDSRIKRSELEIREIALALRQTELAIEANNIKIARFEEKIGLQKDIIAEVMRSIYEEDSRDMIELIVSSGDLSDFFEYNRFLESLQVALAGALENVKIAKANIEEEKRFFEEEQERQGGLKVLQELQRGNLSNAKEEKRQLLYVTRGKKEEFKRMVEVKRKDVEEIRSQLFRLEGAQVALSFEEAYNLAKYAESYTGMRPAFLLSILKQESSFGANVGGCHWQDDVLGRPVMHPERDQPPFRALMAELGYNTNEKPVSCPYVRGGARYGWGGGMGAAQFIPSTWCGSKTNCSNARSYKMRAQKLLGRVPDPWRNDDAFLISAMKLSDAGASKQTYNAEFKAAMLYFSGGSWASWEERLYGRPVMERAARYQTDIDVLEG